MHSATKVRLKTSTTVYYISISKTTTPHEISISLLKMPKNHPKIYSRGQTWVRETYELINDFRTLYNRGITPDKARKRLLEWCQQALILSKKQFATVISTIKNNLFTIASYFRNRATNASAESFNAKVKLFRTQLRGVSDTSFFIFRFTKLFA